MNDISMELFKRLTPEERILFRQEMVVAILQVIANHFTHDSLGNDLKEQLSYCESFVGDFDPFSYFAELEGVGLPENDLVYFNDDDGMTESEQRLHEKYADLKEN